MCEKCLNNVYYITNISGSDYFGCPKCGHIITEEYIKHELLHDKWDDNWRDLFNNFRRYEQDDVQY